MTYEQDCTLSEPLLEQLSSGGVIVVLFYGCR
jgi:hypothetical protein